jgi:hypothetical protein
MAKRTVQATSDAWDAVLAAVRNLRDMHRLGQELLSKYPIGQTSGQRAMQTEAAARNTNTDKLFKARVFADATRGYSPMELQRLCDACKRHRRALGFGFIVRLLTVRNKLERSKLQRQVIVERRSLSQLKSELTSRYGHRRQAGKRPKIGSVADLVSEMGTRAIWWRRVRRLLRPEPEHKAPRWHLTLAQLPEDIQRPFVAAAKALKRLEDAVKAHQDASREGVTDTGWASDRNYSLGRGKTRKKLTSTSRRAKRS